MSVVGHQAEIYLRQLTKIETRHCRTARHTHFSIDPVNTFDL
jgi:hypothetical protein